MRYFIATLLLGIAPSAYAAGVTLVPSAPQVGVGGTAEVGVSLSPDGNVVGSVYGTILLPEGATNVRVSTQGSAVEYWVREPNAAAGTLTYVAMFPGGVATPQELFTFTFVPPVIGTYAVRVGSDTKLYAADGEATEIESQHVGASIAVVEQLGDEMSAPKEQPDTESPLPFDIALARISDDSLAQSIIFGTSDDTSSTISFRLQRSWLPFARADAEWVVVESPYTLTTTDYYSVLYVEARDAAGNARIERIIPYPPLRFVIEYWWLLLLLKILFWFVVFVRAFGKSRK